VDQPVPAPKKSANRVVRLVNIAFLLVGVVALVFMVRKLGVDAVAETIGSVRGWLIPLLLVSVAELFLNAGAIHVFMRPESRMVSYWRVLAAQLSGQAVNSVTPTGTLGEVVKTTILVGHAPRYRAVSSVIAYNIINLLASVLFLLFAMLVSLMSGKLPDKLQGIMLVTFAVLFVLTGLVLYIATHGMIRSIAAVARKLRIVSQKRREQLATKLEEFDDQVRLFGRRREANYTAAFIMIAASRIIGWFDLWLILYALGYSQGFVFVVMAAAAGMIIGTLAAVIPLGIGADEGGQAALFKLLGLGSLVGLAVSLTRRLRTVVIATLGLLVMFGLQLFDRQRYRRASAHIRDRARERDKIGT